MRIFIAPYFAVILSTTLVFFIAVPQETLCNPLAVARSAIFLLEPFITSYLSDMRAKRESEAIESRVWMHTGDPKMNGCGFYLQATGHSGRTKSDYFPNKMQHKCGSDNKYKYWMRMTSQSAMYSKSLHVGNDQVKEIELHADGWQDTMVKMLCFGLNERTIVGGPRAFCVDNNLFKACKGLTNKWSDIDLETNDIKLTRTGRGIHKIIFHNIGDLVNGFETLNSNPGDTDSVTAVCDKIDLVKGGFSVNLDDCPADKTWTQAYGAGMFYSWETKRVREDKNPYGCDRNENRK